MENQDNLILRTVLAGPNVSTNTGSTVITKQIYFVMQAIDDVVSDRFPVTYEESVHLAALRAHVTLGEYSDSINMMDYMSVDPNNRC